MNEMIEFNRMLIAEFREKHGELSGRFENAPILLLTTIGRRSGEVRTAPLMYVRDGDRLIVFASNAGAVRPPFWYENLLVDSNVTVEWVRSDSGREPPRRAARIARDCSRQQSSRTRSSSTIR